MNKAAETAAPDDQTFGRTAVRESLVTEVQVQECLKIQERLRAIQMEPRRLGEILVEKGYLSQEQMAHVLRTLVHASPHPKVTIPGYTLVAKLGAGGMGSVFKARQNSMERLVAIKILAPRYSKDPGYVGRFLQEARAVAKLNHENIITGIDAGEVHGLHYMVMEYAEGESVSATLKREQKIPEKRCLEIAQQVVKALEHAHRNGFVHRDIKPENIIVTKDGLVKLCDLGLAKRRGNDPEITHDGMAVGTPNYISPEQAKGRADVDIRCDIYSLGASLYHMATGTLMFQSENPVITMTMHVSDTPDSPRRRNPALTEAFERLVMKMVQKAPEDRYQTPTEALVEIQKVLHGESIAAPPPATFRPPTSRSAPKPHGRTTRRKTIADLPPERPSILPVMLVLGILAASVVLWLMLRK